MPTFSESVPYLCRCGARACAGIQGHDGLAFVRRYVLCVVLGAVEVPVPGFALPLWAAVCGFGLFREARI